MLQKITKEYANHLMPLECDIYTGDDYPKTNPVFLYFHPGGLVAWARDCVAPWLVQVCHQRRWTLISPSYRLLPQTGGKGLVEDASAAYEFARKWDAPEGQERQVIVGGASGGYFMAALIANHCQPPPLALFSISGINTFRHAFFNSSTLMTPEPIPDSDMAEIIAGPLIVGKPEPGGPSSFDLAMLQADGSKNPDYAPPPPPAEASDESNNMRGMLYDYYTYKNGWLDLVGDVDPGYDWAREPDAAARVEAWPPTVVFHGNGDWDVKFDVSGDMRDALGADKVRLFVAEGQEHLFELRNFMEDEKPGMDAVREAVKALDGIVADA